MKKLMVLVLTLLLIPTAVISQQDKAAEIEAIKNTVETAYVQGVHVEKDVEKMKQGFHEDFIMFAMRDNKIRKVTLADWMKGVGRYDHNNPDNPKHTYEHKFEMVNFEKTSAVIRIEIFRDSKHLYTDFMSLCKFDDGWKIIAKIYSSH